MQLKSNPLHLGLYIHIPFCKTKCNYCSFISSPQNKDKIADYFSALTKEIEYYATKITKPICSIYIGGGTPSSISEKYIAALLQKCFLSFKIMPNAEITIEVNPGTITIQKLKIYALAGINRISMGVQSFNNKSLKFLGRHHLETDIQKSFNLCFQLFTNINVDLIFGYKNQTYLEWAADLHKAIALQPTHISLYDLSIEPKSKFFKQSEFSKDLLLDEDQSRKMYLLAQKTLSKNKFQQYEISNFSLKNKESKHNLIYWNNEEYLGLGVGAISYINQSRYGNTKLISKYIFAYLNKRPLHINKEKLPAAKAATETIILNLRNLQKGADLNKIGNRFQLNISTILAEKTTYLTMNKLVKIKKDKMTLTQKGILLFDHIAVNLL